MVKEGRIYQDRDFPRPLIHYLLAGLEPRSFRANMRLEYIVIRSPVSDLMVLNQSLLFPEICFEFPDLLLKWSKKDVILLLDI